MIEPSAHEILKILVDPVVAVNQSSARDRFGGTNITAREFVFPHGTSADFSASLFAPAMPEFHHIEAFCSMVDPLAGQAITFLMRKEDAQGRKTELVTEQTPPNDADRSAAEIETMLLEPATYRIRERTTSVFSI
jgi:hypothetical protein